MGKPHYPWSVYVPKFFKQYYVVVIGFAVAGTLLCNLPKSEEARRKSKYAQQLDNWGKKDHGHGHGHGHH